MTTFTIKDQRLSLYFCLIDSNNTPSVQNPFYGFGIAQYLSIWDLQKVLRANEPNWWLYSPEDWVAHDMHHISIIWGDIVMQAPCANPPCRPSICKSWHDMETPFQLVRLTGTPPHGKDATSTSNQNLPKKCPHIISIFFVKFIWNKSNDHDIFSLKFLHEWNETKDDINKIWLQQPIFSKK